MSSQLLDGSCGRTTHRQVRTERVPEYVHPAVLDLFPPSRSTSPVLKRSPEHWPAVVAIQHARVLEVTMLPKRRGREILLFRRARRV